MSERCKSCNVAVPHNSNCPLCGKFLREGARTDRYPDTRPAGKTSPKKVLQFIFIAAGFISLFIDLFTSFRGWSVVVCGALVLAWYLALKPVFDRKPFGAFVLYDVILFCIYILVVDLIYDYTGWSLSYVMPSAVAAGITVMLIASFLKKVKWSEIGVHTISLTFLNLVFIILGLCGVHPYSGLCLIVGAYSVLCLFGMRYFLRRSFNEEISRKLHF